MARQYTNQLIDMIDNGLISDEFVVTMCLKYMSEDDVKDMMEYNDIIQDDDDDDGLYF
jgi:hypothetical protein